MTVNTLASAGTGADVDLKAVAFEAYIYTVPLVVMQTTRQQRLGRRGPNAFNHARKLLNHKSRIVTTPNNDTLYSDAWLDLSHGPVTITLPPTGERYCSLALMDMFTNNFAVLGTRTTGNDGGVFTVVGPTDAIDPAWVNVVRAPTPNVWALARILVDGPEDLEAACAVQDGLIIDAPAASLEMPDEPKCAPRSAPWQEYFAAANWLLRRQRPPATDGALLRRIASLGIGPDQQFDPQRFNAEESAAIEAGVRAAREFLLRAQGERDKAIQGWVYQRHNNGNFGQDYAYRAVIAVGGLGALPIEEATYMRPEGEDSDGLLDGSKTWRLHFSRDQLPPVHAFWSLSLYEPTEDGMFFFYANPLWRFAIGDRTPGLKYNDDGSLDIWISHADPGKDRQSNWLPAPNGKFTVAFRAYIPDAAMIQGLYRLPALEQVV